MLATGLLVVHDTSGGGQDHVAELTGGQQLDDPLLEIGQADVVAGRDDTGLVETVMLLAAEEHVSRALYDLPAVQLNDNLARTVVVDLLELANVAYKGKY